MGADKREIKFRGINPYTDEFEYWSPNCDTNTPFPNDFWSTCFEIKEFIGLLDRNGKEIYEGDIVQDEHYINRAQKEKGSIKKEMIQSGQGVIRWIPCGFAIHYKGLELFSLEYIDEDDMLEVIGHSYENPELIESLQERYEDIKRNEEASPDGGDGML